MIFILFLFLLRKYGIMMTNSVRRELMAIYGITPREFMNGKEINHVYKIFNAVDERLKERVFLYK